MEDSDSLCSFHPHAGVSCWFLCFVVIGLQESSCDCVGEDTPCYGYVQLAGIHSDSDGGAAANIVNASYWRMGPVSTT
eukprot:767637-Hanusia_phi.AAC.5